MPIRLLHIIGGLGVGGAERQLTSVLNATDCEFRAVIFIGPKTTGPSFYDDLDPAIQQHFVRIRRRSLPIDFLKLVVAIRKMRADVVHTHMFDSNLYGSIAAKLVGVPVVVTSEHGENPWKKPFHRWLERKVISPRADIRFCVSPQIMTIRRDLDGVPESKLRLAVNGTPLPPITASVAQNPVPVLGAVGRFVEAKDYPGLIHAAKELQRQGCEFKLAILGDGPKMAEVRALVQSLALDDIVELTGMVSDMGSWYERFDIYVSSSVREGQPVALLEAMSHGLPVVATNAGASAETVGDGGLIVSVSNVSGLVAALRQLIEDSGLRQSLGQKSRLRIENNYSVDAIASTFLQNYREQLVKHGIKKGE